MNLRIRAASVVALVLTGAFGAVAEDFVAEPAVQRTAKDVRAEMAAFAAAHPAHSPFSGVPRCLQGLVNKVDVCSQEIGNLVAEVQSETDAKSGRGVVQFGTPLAFPTQSPPGVKAVFVMIPFSKQGQELEMTGLFQANISYGLFWRKQCSLTPTGMMSTIALKDQKKALQQIFHCQ